MRRPVLIGLIAVVALLATAALAAAADQASSPFRDYASPARDQYGGGGPGNGQGNGPADGRPPESPPGQGGGGPPGGEGPPGQNGGGGPPPRSAVKGARAQGSATPSSSGAVKGARASSTPVVVRGATAASVRRAPAGGLPFTGRDLTLFVLVATALLGTGALLGAGERATRSRRRRAHRSA